MAPAHWRSLPGRIDLRHHDLEPACRRDVERLHCFRDGSGLVRRLHRLVCVVEQTVPPELAGTSAPLLSFPNTVRTGEAVCLNMTEQNAVASKPRNAANWRSERVTLRRERSS